MRQCLWCFCLCCLLMDCKADDGRFLSTTYQYDEPRSSKVELYLRQLKSRLDNVRHLKIDERSDVSIDYEGGGKWWVRYEKRLW